MTTLEFEAIVAKHDAYAEERRKARLESANYNNCQDIELSWFDYYHAGK